MALNSSPEFCIKLTYRNDKGDSKQFFYGHILLFGVILDIV